MFSLINDECSICENPLNEIDDLITTNCNHTFHRACVQGRFDKKKRTDCHFCHKDSALGDALGENIEKTVHTDSVVEAGERLGINQNYWQCDKCSVSNEELTRRCVYCGEPRFSRASFFIPMTEITEAPIKNESNKTLPANISTNDNQYKSLHSSAPESFDSNFSPTTTSFHEKTKNLSILEPESITTSDEDNSINAHVLHKDNKSWKQKLKSLQRSRSSSPSEYKPFVYMYNLPSDINDDLQLANLIRKRLKETLQISPINVECYCKLGAGRMRVRNDKIKDRLVKVIGKIVWNPKDDTHTISFSDTVEFVSYIVLKTTNDKKHIDLPKPEEIIREWMKIYNVEKPRSCNQVNIQFPNIFRIVSTSFDELLGIIPIPIFNINDLIAQVYLGAYCSYFEDLPKSTNEDKLREALGKVIGYENISSSSLHIELNKQTNNACIIAANTARKWTTKTFIYLGDKPIFKKENLTYRLVIHQVSDIYNIDTIVNHPIFDNKARIIDRRGENLILEISDKNIFDNCLKFGVFRIEKQPPLFMEVYTTLNDPEEFEIDNDTWYEDEMIRYKPDIMQFIINLDHHIYRYKWNSDIWLQQFRRAISHDQVCRLLQMTVMLNTIGVIRKKSYIINHHQVMLRLDSNLQTIVYNHESKLEKGRPISLTQTPFAKTEVQVVNEDCIVEYKNCIEKYEKPLLLNFANGISPGGGYRQGNEGHEENLFRRSNYFRSLDVELDNILDEKAERFYCSNNCQLNRLSDSSTMYPIDEYGAIYTSGLTFFRKSEDKGYAFMEEPLHHVCSLAIPIYQEAKFTVGMRKKIENSFAIAYHHKHDCLILSTVDTFRSSSDHIAKLFRSVIEQYAGLFQSIIFTSINNRSREQQDIFNSFKNELHRLVLQPFLPFNQSNTMLGPYRILSDGITVSDICIYDLPPCQFGATCQNIYESNHSREFSHPSLCIQALVNTCTQTDIVHISSFIHQESCKYGVDCQNMDDIKHCQEFKHPAYCSQGGHCQDTSDTHEKMYRHLPLCKDSHKCLKFRRRDKIHCDTFRHYMPYCEYGSYCVNFHDKKHLENYKHPFSPPCPFTPYHCALDEELSATKDIEQLSDEIHQHCLEFAHVCRFGHNCINKNPYHLEKSIHIHRPLCSFGEKCNKISQEDHLNSFTHPNICDIRILCKYADKCRNRRDQKHISKFRHTMLFRDSGVVRYYNLNKDIDFIQNQKNNIDRVIHYIQNQNWNRFPSKSIPKNIIDWIRTVQPVHRCKPEVFESILIHGHVMSRNYMENLKKIPCVVHSILHHNRIQQIEPLKKKIYADHTTDYITALVTAEFEKTYSDKERLSPDINSTQMKKNKEVILSSIISPDDMRAIQTTAIDIAQASIKLHSNPSGIGYKPDKDLGTNKNVFSILGPHSGQYGDIFIVFKRDILHHPDANFTIQAGTSYASGNAFKWRPWLGPIPNSTDEQIDLFHKSKLHASVPGYEYATAIELIAVTSHTLKKNTMDINLKQILKVWQKLNSHQTIEAHLPQLIPLDYIEHIYMTKDIFDKFNENIQQVIKINFDNHISIKSFQSKEEYQNFVNKQLIDRFGQRDTHSLSRPIRGFIITIPSTNFTDHFAIPLTISQAYTQYQINHPNVSNDITIYIYWQVMNGDMMLTLSNEQIDTGQLQPELNCLICYLARKPSTKDTHYHEDASYLNNGLPFQHQIFIDEKKYAAKSTSFYVGCNTDDVMSFCLEIHRSTGYVILSHSGPNSIYNHEKISCSFDKTNLDLTQLDFIHVSAGTSSVPIRNLIITFEKESEPLDNTPIKNAESDYLNLLPDSLCDTSTIPSINQSVSHSDKVMASSSQTVCSVCGNPLNEIDGIVNMDCHVCYKNLANGNEFNPYTTTIAKEKFEDQTFNQAEIRENVEQNRNTTSSVIKIDTSDSITSSNGTVQEANSNQTQHSHVSTTMNCISETSEQKLESLPSVTEGIIYITDLSSINKDDYELVAYIVVDTTNDKNIQDLPEPDEVIERWMEIFNNDKPRSCDRVSIEFPNIYRVILHLLNESTKVLSLQNFSIKNRCARIYLDVDCSYLQELPPSITEDQLRQAIDKSIGDDNLSLSSFHIELNKQTNSACVIAPNTTQKWTRKNYIYLGDKLILKKKYLVYRLLLHPLPKNYDINIIVNHNIFNNKAKIVKHQDETLILEISDKIIFDNCIKLGILHIEDKISLNMTVYTALNHSEEREIDADTWYENEMLQYKPDIMQFVGDFEQNIFHFKWNSQSWLEQFKRWSIPNQTVNKQVNQQECKNLSPDQIRHLLRVTVMLNTIAQIRNKNYMINNRKIELNLDQNLQTIVYNHQSKLKHSEPMSLKKTPYEKTEIKVINEDCLVVYERLMNEGKKPLLLNMASATSPGGGYRKGDGAQEENLFRRSDYFRSLDIDLDEYQEEIPVRFHCTSNCNLDSHFDPHNMYPMDEYGAIYTSGLTVFRQPENTGYEYMNKPLHHVCSLAIAAYREPKLDGNMLAPKCAVGMRKKIENIFSIAYHHKHDCLILSALGCGAFRNPPDHVAKLFRSVIEQYAGFFESIIFAIINDHNAGHALNPQGNFIPFHRELHGLIIKPILINNHPNTMIGPYRILSDGLTVDDICIYNLIPCQFGAICQNIYDLNHSRQFSHPSLCIQALVNICTQTDIVHMSSFIHREPCKYGFNCLIQYSDDKSDHNSKYLHPCRFAELCRNPELHLTHEPHLVPDCSFDRNCTNLIDPIHRSQYRHTGLPYFLIPCRDQRRCQDKSKTHLMKYSHGEDTAQSQASINPSLHEHDQRTACKWGLHCLDMLDIAHSKKYSHHIPCKWGSQCYDRSNHHQMKYSHPNLT